MKTILIDPTKLSDEDAKILSLFLQQQQNKKVKIEKVKIIDKNTNYELSIPDPGKPNAFISATITLNHTLVYRQKKIPGNNSKLPRYSVVGDLLGKGDCGWVHLVSGTLSPSLDGQVEFKTHKPRIIKIASHERPVDVKKSLSELDKLQKDLAKHEAELSRSVPYLHAKKATISKKDSNSYIESYFVEKQFPGMSLEKILKNEKSKSPIVIPLEKRFKISLNLLKSLRLLHEAGIIHGDLKPDNVIVDLQTCEVNIIDLGLSKKLNSSDTIGVFRGNLAYCAPESMNGCKDQLADIYAMGLILAELWHAGTRGSNPLALQADNIRLYVMEALRKNIELANLDILFSDISQLNQAQQTLIRKTITSMLAIQPDLRLSLQEAIDEFETVKLLYKVSQVDEKDKLQIKCAHRIANITKRKLEKINPEKDALDQMFRIITSGLDSIPEEAIKEFVDILEIQILNDLDNNAAIINKLKISIEIFKRNRAELQHMRDHVLSPSCLLPKDRLIDYIDSCLHKCNNHQTAFVDMDAFNARITQEIQNLENILKIKFTTLGVGLFSRTQLCATAVNLISEYHPKIFVQ